MATNTTTTLTLQYTRHFSKQLLEHAKHELKLNQFGASKQLPRGMGATNIRFFRRMVADSANVQTLSEGVPITTFTTYTYEKVDVDLAQIGEALKYSDIAGWTALLEILNDGIQYLGENCALKADDLTWAAIAHATTGLTKRYSGGAANYAALVALSAANGKYVSEDGLAALTQLQINRAPRKNGVFVGIIPPQIAFNLKRDTTWVNASTYSNVKQLFQGEIGELDGIRYVETTNVWGEDATEGTRDTTSPPIFASVFTGQDAYGVVELSGKGPKAPKITIVDTPDHADPLNQTLIAGWSAYYASAVLNPNFGVIVRSKSTFA
jgi:N4-gp56 family major capsid protein